jgi:hypothetical protein
VEIRLHVKKLNLDYLFLQAVQKNKYMQHFTLYKNTLVKDILVNLAITLFGLT